MKLSKAINNKLKVKFAPVILALVFLIVYKLSIQKTIQLAVECKELRIKLSDAAEAPEKILRIQNQNSAFDKIFKTEEQGESFQQTLLSAVAEHCQSNQMILREFPAQKEFISKDLKVETCYFTVEGTFEKILKLTYFLEQQHKLGQIASVNYQSKYDKATGIFLTATIFVQNIKKNKL